MHIIGVHPKSLNDFKPLSQHELEAFIKGMESYIQSETPLEIPVGISGNDLGRLTLTLKKLSDLVSKVAHAEAGFEAPGMDQIIERWNGLQEEAKEILVDRPRLIIPK